MENRNIVTDEEFEHIKKFINRLSYIDLNIWKNKMIMCGEINNRVYDLLDKEILRRANELNLYKEKAEAKNK